MHKKIKAFTLIELLVVVAIVGILTGFIFVSMSGAVNSANDGKRKSDLASIQKAILMYQTVGNVLPTGSGCTVGATGCIGDPASNVLSKYLSLMPIDPDSSKHYTYTSSDGTNFSVQATLNNGAAYSYSTTNGWNTGIAGYGHYKIITITNSSGGALTNYPIKLTVYQATGQGSGANCEGLCKTDFTDLAFADVNGNTALPFWLETASVVSNTSVTVWVNVPTITTGSTTQIRMFYNSANPTLTSNGATTFDFFDDFSGASLDSGKWTGSGGTLSFNSGIMDLTNGGTYYSVQTYAPLSYVLRSRANFNKVAWSNCDTLGLGTSKIGTRATSASYALNTWNCSWSTSSQAIHADQTTSGYNIWELKHLSGSDVRAYVNDVQKAQLTTNICTNSGSIIFDSQGTGHDYFDWILLRKYVATEPTTSFGSQN